MDKKEEIDKIVKEAERWKDKSLLFHITEVYKIAEKSFEKGKEHGKR